MILIGAADVGPAKYFIALLHKIETKIACVGSELTAPLFMLTGCINRSNWKNSSPQVVITGTSLGDSLDKELLIWAKQKNIPSISIIEHWSWYKKRFDLNGELVLPDYIFVNDKTAYYDAKKEGLPEDRLIVAGNPVLEKLYAEGNVKLNREMLLQKYNLPYNKRVIVFISEELASEFNCTDSYLGYDEYVVLKKIIKQLQPTDYLIIKLHPEERDDKYSDFLSNQIITLKNIDIHSLNVIADFVIGMASMLLLELAILRNDVISFRPNATKEFIGKRLKATTDIITTGEFKDCFTQKEKQYVDGSFRNNFKGSADRFISLIDSIIK